MQLTLPTFHYYPYSSDDAKLLTIPECSYSELKADFTIATHFKQLTDVNFRNIDGIYIRSQSEPDALLAAIYAYKKYVDENQHTSNDTSPFSWADDELDDEDLLEHLWDDGTHRYLPIIQHHELSRSFQRNIPAQQGDQQFTFAIHQPSDDDEPYWAYSNIPLIVDVSTCNLPLLKQSILKQSRLFIFIDTMSDPFQNSFFDNSINREKNATDIPHHVKSFLFETNTEYVAITEPSTHYFIENFALQANEWHYKLADDVDMEEVIKQLKQYRQERFESVVDIERLLKKATRYTETNVLTQEVLQRFFLKAKVEDSNSHTSSSAYTTLQSLIGLDNVKEELLRLLERLKFVKMREQAGLKNLDHHLGAVFLGNPGTAKTTVARLFCQLLFEANVLEQNTFAEVSRKDLIGKYVGWTAHAVEEIFNRAKGGCVFIDEAYTLDPSKSNDSYTGEAMAAIIQNMENNPDTLVIFAGYPEEMKHFIKNANAGLQSRLTNIISFDDYNTSELIDIFYYVLQSANYDVTHKEKINQCLKQFLHEMNRYSNSQSGNGRLMRKLASTAISYVALRKPTNLSEITYEDIVASCQQLLQSEKQLFNTARPKIGF